jgi:hypothetical protein
LQAASRSAFRTRTDSAKCSIGESSVSCPCIRSPAVASSRSLSTRDKRAPTLNRDKPVSRLISRIVRPSHTCATKSRHESFLNETGRLISDRAEMPFPEYGNALFPHLRLLLTAPFRLRSFGL